MATNREVFPIEMMVEALKARTVVLRALAYLIGCAAILMVAGSASKMGSPLAGMCVVGAIASVLTLGLTVLFVRWDGLKLDAVGAAWRWRTARRAVYGFGIGLVLAALEAGSIFAGGHVHWVAAGRHISAGQVLLGLGGYLLLSMREELAYRGYPLRRLETAWGMWIALLSLAVVFGLEHRLGGWSWWSALTGPVAGAILFGMAALATRGLAVPVGMHAAFNFGQWALGQKSVAGVWRPVVDAGFSRQAEVLGYSGYLGGVALATVGFWILYRRGEIVRG